MASNTKNVKLGVCKVIYGGLDLGYTKGGVDVTVTTETHKVNVDQFGKTTINEQIMGREVSAKVPLAETTIENMVAVMPGTTMTTVGGTPATGSATITTNPSDDDTIVLNGATLTFKTVPVDPQDVKIGATASETATFLAAVLNASTDPRLAAATYDAAAAVVTITYGNAVVYGTAGMKSTEGNAYTLTAGTAGAKVTLSAATLSGGTEATKKFASVATGVGINLLDMAKELRLHPLGKADTDKTDDFVIPRAATPGALTFAYKLEDERVYNVEFLGYPDPQTSQLFTVGK
jgi:hypothetical protein